MPNLIIRGGRVIDPAARLDRMCDLLLDDGKIVEIGEGLADRVSDARVIEAHGSIVCPGFIDLHTHLRFPGFPEKETLASGTTAAAAGGFTTVCAMANTNPVVDNAEILSRIVDAAAEEARIHVRQLGAVSRGLRGEELTDMDALAHAGAVAFSDDGKPVVSAAIMRAALTAASNIGMPISVHEEDPDIVRGGVANAGSYARRHGLAEWPCSGEANLLARDLTLLEEVGGHLHVAHVSCAQTVELVRFARSRGLSVTAEATPHHLRLTDRLLDGDPDLDLHAAHPCTKVNPPLRSEQDVAALVKGLVDGTIDAVATDHAPHTAMDKAGSFAGAAFGFSAIETALPLLLDLVRTGQISLNTAIERLTVGPARVFSLDAGSLVPGAVGDMCIFDPNASWTLRPEAMRSRGKNTPLLGAVLQGRVTHTLVRGEVVYELSTL